MNAFENRAEAVIRLFREVFQCEGRRFGGPSQRVVGISDGLEGVQWNAGYCQREETAWLGVNLEGMRYDDWPVARLIEREIADPLLLTEYRARVERPDLVTASWKRDAWQVRSRLPIREARLAPTPIALNQLDGDGWERALRGARECLDPERNLRGRRRQVAVTLRSGQALHRDVSPHLQFTNEFSQHAPRALQQAKSNLEPLHEWASHQVRPFMREARRDG